MMPTILEPNLPVIRFGRAGSNVTSTCYIAWQNSITRGYGTLHAVMEVLLT